MRNLYLWYVILIIVLATSINWLSVKYNINWASDANSGVYIIGSGGGHK